MKNTIAHCVGAAKASIERARSKTPPSRSWRTVRDRLVERHPLVEAGPAQHGEHGDLERGDREIEHHEAPAVCRIVASRPSSGPLRCGRACWRPAMFRQRQYREEQHDDPDHLSKTVN